MQPCMLHSSRLRPFASPAPIAATCVPAIRKSAALRRGKQSIQMTAASTSSVAAASSSTSIQGMQFHNPVWSKVSSEEEFFATMQAEVAAGRCPPQLIPAWKDFYNNYKTAVLGSGVAGADNKLVAAVQASIADCSLKEFIKPYTFPSFHESITGPDYNYFEFGQRYVGTLVDFQNSVLGHPERWDKVQQLLDQRHNVVLLANHQTEADPGVFAHMLMSTHPRLAKGVVYVAGDRVVTDALCKPFSMGRNLFCVHSKKHMDDDPKLKAAKMETNRKTLVAMQRALNTGGTLIWIAPSGGRDRAKQEGEYLPDSFDPAAVELMRNLIARAKQPGHLFPMAMFSWPLMPPPKALEKAVGERRLTNFTGVGISVSEELDVQAVLRGIDAGDKEKQQKALATAAWEASTAEYKPMVAAIKDASKRGPGTAFAQPWLSS